MIAPPAPLPPGNVAPAVSPEDGRALMPHAAERRAERRRHLLVSLWRLLNDLAAEPAELERRVHRLRVDLDA
jgi:hypothetical protein